MKTVCLIALGFLLALELVTENLSILAERRGLRIAIGLLPAAASVCYALWVQAEVFAWDFPTRLAIAGCLFPLLTALENKLPRYKKILCWVLGGLYLILLLLTAFKG